MILFADLAFVLPLPRTFRYIVPPALAAAAAPGKRARAPLGGKSAVGFIVAVDDRPPEGNLVLKEIQEIVDDEPVVDRAALELTRRLAAHFGSSRGELLAACLPPSKELRTSARIALTDLGRAALAHGRLTGEEKRVAEALGGASFTLLHLKRATGIKAVAGTAGRLRKKGLAEVREKAVAPVRKPRALPAAAPAQLELDFAAGPELRRALSSAGPALAAGRFAAWLLYGDDAARRAACLALISDVLARSRQVLALVPELAQAEPLRDELERKLGAEVAVLHGAQPGSLREAEWRRARSGEARIVIGPRSAVFAPLESAGLILVWDESDEAYLQTDSPVYDARRAARTAAEIRGSLLVLGSDSPTVESFHRAREEGWLVPLPAAAPAPPGEIVDDRGSRRPVAPRVLAALGEAVGRGGRCLVFAPRRGFASHLVCPRCGHVPRCERCEISLTYYKREERLACRYCGATRLRPAACPDCGGRFMEPRGAGAEAIEEELRRALPGARVAGLDGESVRTRSGREKAAAAWADGRIDILVGTELLARRDLAGAARVAVLNPESRLAQPDFRSSQRAFLALRRAARCAAPDGAVLVQTSAPDHHAVRGGALGDYEAFFGAEIELRRLMGYPPFTAMAEIVLPGRDLRPLARRARDLIRFARELGGGLEATGPGLAPPSTRRGERGLQIILKAGREDVLDEGLARLLERIPGRRTVTRFD